MQITTQEYEGLKAEVERRRAENYSLKQALAMAVTWALGEGPKTLEERSERQRRIAEASGILLNQQSGRKE